ncbi:helix-turn-helix transcriptional regulator [Enterococcus hulanensis]|uniref:Helix-turn-helix transcriptional regulator n=1 Tax=Enterococcus hulanensis TaxID=2559929 RepID=A0ABU3ETV5_9ENTE|nr:MULTISPECIES: helix-turn-helix transcriptional regulator [Enterococcus]MBO0410328.1 helix-turn-helix transcriptional regulator [Enterococcus hulanensis]MBO0455624.1 helix-turn-helix transcriptional regulator [Enterococcus hulanensis]MBX8936803.1 helix-turn-helix transcriptional regulator [Enterococcus gilvus]MDT2598283.1 helix-turn-helix transcriptional regulator [Enterococcus hulanensis]MDT2608212.1 helix-turn-helix transcriptional regulator [Enterococcus hulanensis]
MGIQVQLDLEMVKKKMKLNDLADEVGITTANLSRLKNGKVSAIRFSTLEKICEVLDCQPGDILIYQKE